jgi:hypothetical protein
MDGKEYLATQIAILEVSKRIRPLNLKGFIEALGELQGRVSVSGTEETAKLQRRALDNMSAVKWLAQNMLLVQEAAVELDKTLIAPAEEAQPCQ